MTEQREVVVVGAGPVGLCLALGLARSGVDVLVLEKQAGTAEHSRAPAVWPGTQQVLAELGVIGRFLDQGIRLDRLDLLDVDRQRVLLTLPVHELADETPYAQLLIVPQSTTERLLREELRRAPTAELRFSSEAVELRQDGSGVEVRYRCGAGQATVRGRFVAGCDGAHSRVREALGAHLEGITYGMRAALADIALPGADHLPFPRLTTRPRLAIGIRIDTGLWRLILPFAEDGRVDIQQRVADAVRHLFGPVAGETVWESEFGLHRRVATRWLDRRIVLAGDAAHLNSPVGGEGMNAGILDAAALRQALVQALAGDDPQPLAGYAEARRAAIAHGVNPFTDRLTRALLAGRGAWIRPVLGLASTLLRVAPLRRRMLRRLALLER